MSELYKVAGTSVSDQLLAKVEADPIAINLLPGQGELKRGLLLYKNASGFYVAAASAQITTSYDIVVLGEDVDTGSDDEAVADVAMAYRGGTFIDGRVVLASDAAVTEAHKVVLRMMGIKFAQSVQRAGIFSNGPFTITYVANNSVTPAEADVEDTSMPGSYTALANTDTNFTAPATKSFSKWNTKADGSGTDVSAGGSMTITGDVKLYAIWA